MMNTRVLFGITSLLLVGCAMQTDIPLQTTESGSKTMPSQAQASRTMPMVSTGALTIGERNAPVQMLLFTNYDCAYCKEFEQTIMPHLRKDFIETGKLHASVVPLPLLKYPGSDRNARLLLCGIRGGSGSIVHEALWNGREVFPALEECMKDELYLQKSLEAQQSIIQKLNIALVPTYFINEKQFTGLPEYADLRGQIEEALPHP